MGEFEMLIYTIISMLEYFKEDGFNFLIENNNGQTIDPNVIKKLGIDQSKILRKSAEYYNITHQNMYSLIINYFNK
jgi:hypothetical protein